MKPLVAENERVAERKSRGQSWSANNLRWSVLNQGNIPLNITFRHYTELLFPFVKLHVDKSEHTYLEVALMSAL